MKVLLLSYIVTQFKTYSKQCWEWVDVGKFYDMENMQDAGVNIIRKPKTLSQRLETSIPQKWRSDA